MRIFSPNDAKKHYESRIPEFVTDAFNELLSEQWHNGKAIKLYQDEVIERIIAKMPKNDDFEYKVQRRVIFDKKWLDIEDMYIQNGWSVEYDKPAYCETYEPFWIFKPL